MDATLKKICNACKVRGNLLSKDWDALQLPSLPREGKFRIYSYHLCTKIWSILNICWNDGFFHLPFCSISFLKTIFVKLKRLMVCIGPQYTTINARLENMDVIIPPSTNFQSN